MLALGIWSCGSLKKHKEETKEEKEFFSNSNTEINYQLDKFSIEPVDLQRPILVGGKEYHNTKIVVEKEVGKIDQVENTGEKSKNENLLQDKEKDNTWLIIGIVGLGFLFLLFVFIISLVVIYYILSKKISLIPKV